MPSAKLHFYPCCHDIEWSPRLQLFSFLCDLCHLISVLPFKKGDFTACPFFCWVIPAGAWQRHFWGEQVFYFCHAKSPLAKVLLPFSTKAFWYLCKTLPRVTLCTLSLLAQSANCVSGTFWWAWACLFIPRWDRIAAALEFDDWWREGFIFRACRQHDSNFPAYHCNGTVKK